MASTTLLFDQRRQAWSDELLAASGIDRGCCAIRCPAARCWARSTPPRREPRACPRARPWCSAATITVRGPAHRGLSARRGLDVTGTWEMVVAAIPEPVLTPAVREMGILVDSHVARGTWTAMGATVAADMLEWFRSEYGRRNGSGPTGGRRRLGLPDAGRRRFAARGPRLLFLPHMSGSHCPVVDHRSLGAFVGLRNITHQGRHAPGDHRGLGLPVPASRPRLRAGLGVRPEQIVAIGGAINNDFWMQNKADVVGKPIEVPELEEAVLLGRRHAGRHRRGPVSRRAGRL